MSVSRLTVRREHFQCLPRVLVYQTDPPRDSELVLLNREGKRLSVLEPPGRYADPAISPNGERVAYARTDTPTGTQDIYLAPISLTAPSKFTSGPQRNWAPVWSPEGTRIAFQSNRQTAPGVYSKSLDGSKEDRVSDTLNFTPTDWSRTGVIIGERRGNSAGIFTVLSSGASPLADFFDTEFQELSPSFSLDGRWVSYQSNETGQAEVYVGRFDSSGQLSGRPERISGGAGGRLPRWSRDGKELFYLTDDSDGMMAVEIRANETLKVGTARLLLSVNLVLGGNDRPYAVSRDGQRFVMVVPLGDPPPLTVLQNWTARLKR
jgi:eukaryotic-like serine/threonine-protein kinase